MSELPPATQEDITREQIDELADQIEYFVPYMQESPRGDFMAAQFGIQDKLVSVAYSHESALKDEFVSIVIVCDLSQAQDGYMISTSYSVAKNDERSDVSVRQDIIRQAGESEIKVDWSEQGQLWQKYRDADGDDEEQARVFDQIFELKRREEETARPFGVPGHGFTQDKFREITNYLSQIDPIKDIIEPDEA